MTANASRSPLALDGRLAPVLFGASTVVAIIALWETAARAGWVRAESFPPFTAVAAETWQVLQAPEFAANLGASAGRWVIGFTLAIAIGVPLGLLMGRISALHRLIDPILVVSYPVPKAALILVFIFWWGAGMVSQVAIIVIGCLLPIVISSYHGAHLLQERVYWSGRALGTSRARMLLRVVLPAAVPQIASGLRLAIAVSIFTMLSAELLVRSTGIGAWMFTNFDNGQTNRVWAIALLLALIGFALDFGYVRLVRLVVPWFDGEV